jgi:AraC-like DNA-binding protein
VEYFSRMFKKEYGVSPSNWIKNLYWNINLFLL